VTVTVGQYFPATVLLPNGETWRRVYIIVASGDENTGLHIWRKPEYAAEWHADIDWDRTTIPGPWKARAGFSVHTDRGLVVITPGGGCACGPLARWSGPPWNTTVMARAR